MNVVRIEDGLAPRGRRGAARGRARAGDREAGIVVATERLLPKYDFPTYRQPLVNAVGFGSTSAPLTPNNINGRRTTGTRSSLEVAPRWSSARRRGQQQRSGGETSARTVPSDSDPYCVVLAITCGRGDARGEVGLAAIDVQYPHMILCQMSDRNAYTDTLAKIHALNPVEILMPDTVCQRGIYGNALYRAVREKFESVTITAIARRHFHDTSGFERIATHCAPEFSSVRLFVRQKYYALAAASALFKYVEYVQRVAYAPKSMRIDFQGSGNTTAIDVESARSLELVACGAGGGPRLDLLGSLDRCSTPMGRRLLRASILQPPCDPRLIEDRQECVARFVADRSLVATLGPVVKRLYGACRLPGGLAMMTSQADSVRAAEKNLNYVLLLKSVVDAIPELRAVISAPGDSRFLEKDLEDSRYRSIKDLILRVVHPEARSVTGHASSNMHRCFAIRSGINDMLDIARQTYCELIDDMRDYVEQLSERHGLRLSLGCSPDLGYHIETSVAERRGRRGGPELPQEFIEVHGRGNRVYATTEHLLALSEHCREACAELHLMSNVLLNETLTGLREHVGCLLTLSDDLGELDLALSLARISSLRDYVRPSFGQRLDVRDSRHPIMDISSSERPVANDVVASRTRNFYTITGPNMSGKSVYLKQIVLLQIMAQMGCYVPATTAAFRIADRIFCRMRAREDIETDASSFVLEIREARYVLRSITPTCLVVLDELCRGTTVEEGTSIAWSICERLLATSAFVFSATHFLHLTRLAEFYPNASNRYMETRLAVLVPSESQRARLIYTHELKSGVVSVWNYGIALARATGLPEDVVSRAEKLADEVARSVRPADAPDTTGRWKRTFHDCLTELSHCLEDDRFTVDAVVRLVNRLGIPGTLGSLKNSRSLENEETSGSATSSHSEANFHRDETDDGRTSAKRRSISRPAPHSEVKKSRPCSEDGSSVPPFVRETDGYLDMGNSPDSANRARAPMSDADDDEDDEAADSSSISSRVARKTARDKEAQIFRNIEGSDFDEADFFRSLDISEDWE